MRTLPDAALMCAIAQPALLTKLVRSKGMFRKFRHRYDNPNRIIAFNNFTVTKDEDDENLETKPS